MRILADSNITLASITATNVLSTTLTNKLKTFQLTDNMKVNANTSVIDFTFNGVIPNINMIGLCGTNLTATAVINVSYSDTNIETPDATIQITTFSTLNQILFLASTLNKKYWRISIVDTGLSSFFVGYLYVGVYLEIPFVEFGHAAGLQLFSNPSVSPTGQGYGGKVYSALPVDFSMLLDYDTLNSYIAIKQEKHNIDPVLLVEYIESYDNILYRPKFGVLANPEIPYPQSHNNLNYSIPDRLEERF